jgi:pyrophosphate--fructose-6-phosphate 1-phosphotransferase
VALDSLNPGEWFAKQFTDRLEAEKTLVQKSGYFAGVCPEQTGSELIKASGKLGAKLALDGQCGVVGMDEEKNGELGLIDFERIKGGNL